MGRPRTRFERSHPARALRTALAVLFAFAIPLCLTPVARAGSLVFEGSVDHADYGEGESSVLSAALAWRAPRWSLSVTVPGVRQTAPVFLRVGPMTVPGGEQRELQPPHGSDGGSDDGSGGGHGDGGGNGGGEGDDGGNGNGGGHGSGGGDGGDGDGGEGGGSNGGDGNGGGGNGNGGTGGDGEGGGSTDGGLTSGGDPQTSGSDDAGRPAETETVFEDETGIGDPVVRLDVALPGVLGAGVRWGLFGALKVPVADEALGTEEWDFGAGLLLWRTGLLTDLYLELGHWTLGDPDGLELDDPLTWRAYLTRRLASGEWAFAALTQGTTEVIDGVGSSAEAGVWVGRFFGGRSSHRSVGLSTTVGLDDAAPDWSVTLSWRLGVTGLRPERGP